MIWADNVHPKSCVETKIDSHAHVERDRLSHTVPHVPHKISTHTLTWSVTEHCWRQRTFVTLFQLTRSRGAWLYSHIQRRCYPVFQLTRSRGAWLNFLTMRCISLKFQLTRSRGAWLNLNLAKPKTINFNSHAHVERDDARPTIWQLTRNFNSHAHVERDNYVKWQYDFNGNFNSHAHVERDRKVLKDCVQIFHFNSHAHVERDCLTNMPFCVIIISTHTLTWSVTCDSSSVCRYRLFQLTRSRGAWQ